MTLPKQMINAKDTVTLCIGGRVFVTRRATLYRLPDSRLYMIANRPGDNLSNVENSDSPVFFFDRDPEIFRFVLDYYRTGELHLPSNICGPFVRKELIFWGIDESLIGPCCMPAYMRYDEEKRTKATLFRDCFEDIDSIKNLVKCSRGLKQWRYTVWLFLDHPTSSLMAKIWSSILLSLMIMSFMCFCLGTHEDFRRPTTKRLSYNISRICDPKVTETNRKFKKDCTTEPLTALVILDVVLNVIFSVEFILKLLLSPDKMKFLKSSVSILDIFILSAYWVYMSIFYFYYYYDDKLHDGEFHDGGTLWLLNIMSMTQSLRILRIFKISKISRGLRVLMLTVKKSIPELVLLGFLLMNGMFLFSSLIYLAEYKVPETFPDIPKAFWWSIVTLTTVGYGDSYPKGAFGYLIGSCTAICGCIVTGLAIPIIGNNFNTYYMYMKNQIKEDKYLKEHDRGNAPVTTKNHILLQNKMRRFANKKLEIFSSLKTDQKVSNNNLLSNSLSQDLTKLTSIGDEGSNQVVNPLKTMKSDDSEVSQLTEKQDIRRQDYV